MHVPVDDYIEEKDHYDEMKKYGVECVPVDLNHQFVPTEKYDKTNLDQMQESIEDRME